MKSFFKNEKYLLGLILLLSLIIRLLFVLQMEDRIYWSDGVEYDKIAVNLINGKGMNGEFIAPFPATYYSYRPPGYPAFLALVYYLFGRSFIIVRLIQALLGVCLVFFIYLIGRKVFSSKVGLVSAAIACIYPFFVYTTGSFYSITLVGVLLAFSVYCLLGGWGAGPFWNRFFAALSLGAAILCQPSFLIIPPFVSLYDFLRLPDQHRLKRTIVFWGTIFAILAPWGLRNYSIHHKFFLTSNGGYNFWLGNNPLTTSTSGNRILVPDYLMERLKNIPSEIDRDNIFLMEAKRFILGDPGRYFKLALAKALNLWRLYPAPLTKNKYVSSATQWISALSYGPILLLAVLGIFLNYRVKKETILFLLMFLSFSLLHGLFFSKVRFRLPLDPYLVILAGSVIVYSFDRWRGNGVKDLDAKLV